LGAIDAMLTSDDPRSPQRELEVCATVEHSARTRVDARWRGGVQAVEDLRREVSRALFCADELHARAKAAGLEALTTRRTALERARDPRPPAAGAQEKRPAAAIREPSKRQ